MSEPPLPPSTSTTLVILFGASAWPDSPGFEASKAFVHAAQGFVDYLLDPHGFGLSKANFLNLFDTAYNASDQLEHLGSFLEERTKTQKAANLGVRDVLVYFVGHGGFAGPSADFYLLLRRTNASSLRASGMAIDALAEVLREKARQMRRYLFLDCCFAAAAFRAFQGGPDQIAIAKTLDAFHVQARSSGFPRKGTVLLCSSDQKSPSLLLPDESCTMFSYALLDVLRNGDLYRPHPMSLRDIKGLVEDRLAESPEKNAPRPGLYSPDQSYGDVADVPFFPNPSVEREQALQAEEKGHRHVFEQVILPNPDEQHQSEALAPGQDGVDLLVSTGHVSEKRLLSRRAAIVGIAGVVGLAISGSGLAWLASSRTSISSFSPRPTSTPLPTTATPLPTTATPLPTTATSLPTIGTALFTYHGNLDGVNSVAWSPDGKRIASSGGDSAVQVWNASDGTSLLTYRGHSNPVWQVAWSPDGTRIASASLDHTVQVWNAANGNPICTCRGHIDSVFSVTWSPDGKRIASGAGGGDRTARVWNAADGTLLLTYNGHGDNVFSVAWSPDGKRIASGGNDWTVQVWNPDDGTTLSIYHGHASYVISVAWSPDGKHIASGGADWTVRVWNAANGNLEYTYSRHFNYVKSVAWSPDGKRIASGSFDKTVQVWKAFDGTLLVLYRGHASAPYVTSVAWSPDDKHIASAASDVQIWQAG